MQTSVMADGSSGCVSSSSKVFSSASSSSVADRTRLESESFPIEGRTSSM